MQLKRSVEFTTYNIRVLPNKKHFSQHLVNSNPNRPLLMVISLMHCQVKSRNFRLQRLTRHSHDDPEDDSIYTKVVIVIVIKVILVLVLMILVIRLMRVIFIMMILIKMITLLMMITLLVMTTLLFIMIYLFQKNLDV